MSEPLRTSYSREEGIERARQFMLTEFGVPKDLSEPSRDAWLIKLGVLVSFCHVLFPVDDQRFNPATDHYHDMPDRRTGP